MKYINPYFLRNLLIKFFRFVFLVGISYIVLFPFITKISGSFMSITDFVDVQVKLIPKNFTLDTYKAIVLENKYWQALLNTSILSIGLGAIQMIVCALVGYGFSKFKFKGSSLLFLGVLLTMIIPHQTLQMSLFMKFRFFDIWGIGGLITSALGAKLPNLLGSAWPLIIMSATGLAFRNGLFIFVMRQFYRGIPDELEEAAYVDGAGPLRTFVQIILPLSIPMMVTIFMFAFSWQWSDTFYTNLFFSSSSNFILMPDIVKIPASLNSKGFVGQTAFETAINNTCGLLILLPLVVVYLFAQKTLIQGIERSGVTG
ncbi:MAG: hypothetical protein A2Y17_09290 [Clostridiales bacterium GWF2_38_85]|nr:MAG: hypothetical protein A2Y17_09290 [Clostridiales bacterium GWF2_38_85]